MLQIGAAAFGQEEALPRRNAASITAELFCIFEQ
jgi:hypothetical protein